MATYLVINLVVLVVVIGWLIARKQFFINRPLVMTLATLLLATAWFDSLIIIAGIVAYDTTKLLGIFVGAAPIEDFFYALLAGLLVPAVWRMTNKERKL